MANQQVSNPSRLSKTLPYILIIGGVIALVCSFLLLQDKINLLINPHFRPNCDLNPIVSCSDVMTSKQGSVVGFPNPIIGMAAYPVLITIGVSQLAGATFKRWLWQLLNFGLLLASIFILWLFIQSVYFIQALCPYCMVVWVMTITLLWYVTLYNLEAGNLVLGNQYRRLVRFARQHHLEILVSLFIIVIVLILQHFWYYYGKYF